MVLGKSDSSKYRDYRGIFRFDLVSLHKTKTKTKISSNKVEQIKPKRDNKLSGG